MLNLNKDLIKKVISEAVGEDVLPLFNILKKKGEHAELNLAEKLGIEVNYLRNMLYRLHQHNLVKSERRRDPENGWHIYWWTLQDKGLEHLFMQLTKKNLTTLQKKLDKESSGPFYQCFSNCAKLEFDEAFCMDFHCPECGELMNLAKNDPGRIKALEEQISLLKGLMNWPEKNSHTFRKE